MQKINMVDLVGQYSKIKTEIDGAIQNVIQSSAFINGPEVKEFKAELSNYLNIKHVIPCGNGTDALQIALMSLNLQPGDEVIVPDFTFIATAEVAAVLGLKPIFADVDIDTFNIIPDKIEQAITEKTKAIIPVHLYGQCAPMNEIMQIAQRHNLYVIEDNAQSLGAAYQYGDKWLKGGTIGDIGCASFFPSKNLGAYGDGGAIMTSNEKLAENIAAIANHGARRKYYNDEVGVNSRLDSMQAAILRIKLPLLDSYNKARQDAASRYDENLKYIEEIEIPKRAQLSTHVFHQYTLKVRSNRNELKNHLTEHGIPSMIYYPVPMHKQKAYECSGDFKNSEFLSNSVLSLPMHTELSTDQQDYICDTIIKYFKNR